MGAMLKKMACDNALSDGECLEGIICLCKCKLSGWFEIAFKDTMSGGGVDEPMIPCGQRKNGKVLKCDSIAECRLKKKVKDTMIGLAVLAVLAVLLAVVGFWIVMRHKHKKGGEASAQEG